MRSAVLKGLTKRELGIEITTGVFLFVFESIHNKVLVKVSKPYLYLLT